MAGDIAYLAFTDANISAGASSMLTGALLAISGASSNESSTK